eukprot:TRINITY_DN4281_c0_g1_i1.p1 TRINITY_DN4281_c0_g1~~TRINITY_DN4281_c0_g1_i1.p1  ORF type:complete len:358 (+),score=20.25 TRINITY_DN4281_c0_g1_i1:37-1074(+)
MSKADKDRQDLPPEDWRRIVKVNQQGTPPPPLCDHSACIVEGEKKTMLIFGGYSPRCKGPTNDIWEYEIESTTWTKVEHPANAIQPSPRYSHTTCMVGDTMVVFGGSDGDTLLREVWHYKIGPESREWKKVKNENGPSARCYHCAVKVSTDAMLVIGGFDGNSRLNDVWYYTPHNCRWTEVECSGFMPSPRDGAAAYMLGNVVYLFGGFSHVRLNDFYTLDWDTKVWSRLAQGEGLPAGRTYSSMLPWQEKLYIFHGFDGQSAINDVYEFDPKEPKWKKVEWTTPQAAPDLVLEKKFYHSVVLLEAEKKVICFGGNDGQNYMNSLWDYEFGEPAEKETTKGRRNK